MGIDNDSKQAPKADELGKDFLENLKEQYHAHGISIKNTIEATNNLIEVMMDMKDIDFKNQDKINNLKTLERKLVANISKMDSMDFDYKKNLKIAFKYGESANEQDSVELNADKIVTKECAEEYEESHASIYNRWVNLKNSELKEALKYARARGYEIEPKNLIEIDIQLPKQQMPLPKHNVPQPQMYG